MTNTLATLNNNVIAKAPEHALCQALNKHLVPDSSGCTEAQCTSSPTPRLAALAVEGLLGPEHCLGS